MTYDSETIGNIQVDQFVAIVPEIYERRDRMRSLWDVWLHTLHHASAIGEEVRKGGQDKKLLVEIATFSRWLFTMLGKLHGAIGVKKDGEQSHVQRLIRIGNDYSALLWNKYPRACPVCFWRRTKGNGTSKDKDKIRAHSVRTVIA